MSNAPVPSKRINQALCIGLLVGVTAVLPAPAPAAAKRADLTVTAVTAPARATAGAKITLRATVRNGGSARAGGSVLVFKLSTDQKVGRDSALAPTKATPQLKPRKRWSGSVAVTVPAKVTPGRYYVLACADATKKVREKSEANNCRVSRAVQVAARPSSHDLIDEAIENGELSEEQGLTYKVFSDFKDPRLPAKYAGNPSALQEGALGQAADDWPNLSAATQDTLRPFLIPPYYAGSHWSPGKPAGARAPVAAADAPWCSGTSGSSPLFSDWDFLDVPGGQYRIWWEKGNAADAVQAAHMSHLIATTILPELTALMGRGPKSDAGEVCNGETGATDIALLDAATAQVNGNGFLCGSGVSSRMVWPRSKPAAWAGSDPYLAHEIMHTIQFGFPQDGWCGDYEWLREMTAQWVMDYVTDPAYGIGLGPDDTEFAAVPHFMDVPNTSLDAEKPRQHGYGAYLLAQWGAKNLGQAWIKDIWDNVAGMDATHAVNKALRGKGFEELWDDFALSNWNQGPIKDYQVWDNMTKSAKLAGTEQIPVATPRNPTIKVNHLAAQYLELDIDPKVDELEIANDKAGDTYAQLRAVVSYTDGTHKVFILDKPTNYLCINDGTKQVSRVVLVFSNSHMEDETTFAPTLTGKAACACPNSTARPGGRAAGADVCEGGNVTFTWTHENIKLNDDGTEKWHIDESGSGSLTLELRPDPDDPETYVNSPTSTYTVNAERHAEFYGGCEEIGDTTHEGAGNLGEFATFTTFDGDELWVSNAILMATTKRSVTTTCLGTDEQVTTDHLITPECPPSPEGGNYFWEFEPVAPGSDTYEYTCSGTATYEDGLGQHTWTKTVTGTLTLP